MAKPSITTLVTDLATELREEYYPHLGTQRAALTPDPPRAATSPSRSTKHAEQRMEAFLAERAPEVSFYSEDRGLVSPAGDRAEWVLIVGPDRLGRDPLCSRRN